MRGFLGKSGVESFSARRIEALTDGVFAIAMTLLVLDLKVQDLGHLSSNADLINALSDNFRGISSFVVSFLVLGSMWAVHMRQFEYIKNADRHLTMLNTLRLLVVVLIPLTTSIAGQYSDLLLGRIMLPINFLALTIISYWQWRYAVSKKSGLNNKMPKSGLEDADIRNQAIIILSAGVVILSVWLGELAFIILFLVPTVIKLLRWRNRTKN